MAQLDTCFSEESKRLAERADLEWRGAKPLQTYFPLELAFGAKVREFTAGCGRCGDRIEAAMLRGTAIKVLPDVIEVRAHGVCNKCNVITPFTHRIRENKEGVWEEYLQGKRWVTGPIHRPRPKWKRWLLDCIARVFGTKF